MASTIASQTASNRMKVTSYLSGDASSAKDIEWVDMSGYGGIMITATAAALTGLGVTAFKILANPESDGGGTDVEIKAHAVGSAPDADGDMLVLECSAAELADLGDTLRYVSANITCANSSDNIVVTYIRHSPRFAQDGLTADVVAS